MSSIKRILNKEVWTGRELGIVILTQIAQDFDNEMKGKRPKPLTDAQKIRAMLQYVSQDPIQHRAYLNYATLSQWINLFFNIAESAAQALQVNLLSMSLAAERCIIIEQARTFARCIPRIMTEKQYNDEVNRRREAILSKSPVHTAADAKAVDAKAEAEVLTGDEEPIANATRGLAILKSQDKHVIGVNDDGDYTPRDIAGYFSKTGIEGYFKEDPRSAERIEYMKDYRRQLRESYRYLKGYNKTLELMGKAYSVPDVTAFCVDLVFLESKIDAFNEELENLYSAMTEGALLQSVDDLERKTKTAQSVFSKIVYSDLDFTEEEIEAARNDMKDFKAFQSYPASGILPEFLCTRVLPADTTEGGGSE